MRKNHFLALLSSLRPSLSICSSILSCHERAIHLHIRAGTLIAGVLELMPRLHLLLLEQVPVLLALGDGLVDEERDVPPSLYTREFLVAPTLQQFQFSEPYIF